MDEVDDPLREQLLGATRRVFARQGYEGTRIGDIVRESGLSTGAVYGRFRSKNELLREAVVGHARFDPRLDEHVDRVADLIVRGAAWSDAELTLDEAVRLEAHVAARREPEVAQALHDANDQWRNSVEPLVQLAAVDGTVAADVDAEAVLSFVRTMALGLLLQRAAGTKAPDPTGWSDLMHRVVASIGAASPTDSTSAATPSSNSPSSTTQPPSTDRADRRPSPQEKQ